MSGVQNNIEHFKPGFNRIIMVACGTSWHAVLFAEYIIEDFTGFRLKLNTLPNSGTGIPSLIKEISS